MTSREYDVIERHMLNCMTDSAHDSMHIYRVLGSALDIASTEPQADIDIIIAASLLHDIGRAQQAENPALDHATVGAPMARDFLVSIDWTQARANHVADCVRTHRYRAGDAPATIEAKIIYDADKLDVCGAIGVSRTLIYGGQVTEPLYVLDAQGRIITDGGGAEISSFFQEFNWKLRDIYDKMLTQRGRELAQSRRATAHRFYDELTHEITLCHTSGTELLRKALH